MKTFMTAAAGLVLAGLILSGTCLADCSKCDKDSKESKCHWSTIWAKYAGCDKGAKCDSGSKCEKSAEFEADNKKDIVETAVAAGKFKTLAAALKAAGLIETLQGAGPFTVFAPTDEAFAKLPKGTVEELLKPENAGRLKAILTYHVVGGEVSAKDAAKLSGAKTVQGSRVAIDAKDGVKIGGAKVVAADIRCRNGVIHIIDSVLLPSDKKIMTTAAQAGQFRTLITAVAAAGLFDSLQAEGPFTVFAPSDDAFAKLPEGTLESLLEDGGREKLIAILSNHVVPGRFYSEDLKDSGRLKTLSGTMLRFSSDGDGTKINDATLIAANIDAANGVIHVVDSVILPETKKEYRFGPKELIREAVRRGVPIFNSGQHGCCAAIYEMTAISMLSLGEKELPENARRSLQKALDKAEKSDSAFSKAWALRYGLDAAYRAL